MSQLYEGLITELRERNRNGLIFHPFEKLYQKVLMEGFFGNGIYDQIIDHPSVTVSDRFILADLWINNDRDDHFTLGRVLTLCFQTFNFLLSKFEGSTFSTRQFRLPCDTHSSFFRRYRLQSKRSQLWKHGKAPQG